MSLGGICIGKNCLKCGAELTEGAKFCIKCGANVKTPPSTSTQPQTYQPIAYHGNINKKIIPIIAIIVTIIIVVAIVILVTLSDTNSFIGKWSIQTATGGPSVIWTVYKNNSVKQEYNYGGQTYIIWGYWEVTGEQVCGYWENDPSDYRCIKIEYSQGGNRLTGYYNGELFFSATRI